MTETATIEATPIRKRHHRALDIRPAVHAFIMDGRTGIPAYLTTAEAAAILGVAVKTIWNLCDIEKLQSLARGSYRVSAESVLRYRSGGK